MMGAQSTIEWTDASWTPIRARAKASGKLGWHCEHVSEGCRNCYAETQINRRFGTGLAFKPGHRADIDLFLDETMLTAPLRWKKPRMVFVCSMTDLFADFVPDEWIDRMFAVMALAPQHTFQPLTKRPERLRGYLSDDNARFRIAEEALRVGRNLPDGYPGWARHRWKPSVIQGCSQPAEWPLPNVWAGTSVEDQASADARIPQLLATPAAVRFVSYEPALGAVDFVPWLHDVDWIIAGGESGAQARPAHPDWFRKVRDDCRAAGVAFFFKQWGEWAPIEAEPIEAALKDHGRELKACLVAPDGKRLAAEYASQSDFPFRSRFVYRIGKKRAGRLLDGIEHNGLPGGPASSHPEGVAAMERHRGWLEAVGLVRGSRIKRDAS